MNLFSSYFFFFVSVESLSFQTNATLLCSRPCFNPCFFFSLLNTRVVCKLNLMIAISMIGLMISGAISLAVKEINTNGTLKEMGHSLKFIVAETFGEEVSSIRQTARLWTDKVYAYIGPQETCVHEGRMAAAFNLPMISYVSSCFHLYRSIYFSLSLGFSPFFLRTATHITSTHTLFTAPIK